MYRNSLGRDDDDGDDSPTDGGCLDLGFHNNGCTIGNGACYPGSSSSSSKLIGSVTSHQQVHGKVQHTQGDFHPLVVKESLNSFQFHLG